MVGMKDDAIMYFNNLTDVKLSQNTITYCTVLDFNVVHIFGADLFGTAFDIIEERSMLWQVKNTHAAIAMTEGDNFLMAS